MKVKYGFLRECETDFAYVNECEETIHAEKGVAFEEDSLGDFDDVLLRFEDAAFDWIDWCDECAHVDLSFVQEMLLVLDLIHLEDYELFFHFIPVEFVDFFDHIREDLLTIQFV